jgi:hypothetical protein
MKKLVIVLVAVMTLPVCGMNPASAKWPPKLKNTPFDAGTWNPIKKGGNKGNVSGLTVMTPAHIQSDGRVLGPTSRSDQRADVLGQATIAYEGRQAYWTWNGQHGPLRSRATQYDNTVDDGGVIEMPPKKPTNNNGFNNNGFNTNNNNNNGFNTNNNGFNNNGPRDPWYEAGREIGKAIRAEIERNQGR